MEAVSFKQYISLWESTVIICFCSGRYGILGSLGSQSTVARLSLEHARGNHKEFIIILVFYFLQDALERAMIHVDQQIECRIEIPIQKSLVS